MRLIALFALLLPLTADAVVVSRLYNFEADTPAQADQVDAELDNIISAINGNLDSSNLAQNAVATGNIASAAVTTAKIASGSVTKVKLAALGQATSNSSLSRFVNTSTEIQIENLVAAITPSGRPVWIGLQSVPNLNGRILYQHAGLGATDNAAVVSFHRDGATRNVALFGARQTAAGDIISQPCSSFWFIDVPDAGEVHSYTVFSRVATGDSGMVRFENCQLILFEM